ncbi:MAG: hypothetical protein SPD11_05180 [Sphaerochaetaceae bacterium]|nr:hypothetical protein [Sphaerochaetaceae bacterium]
MDRYKLSKAGVNASEGIKRFNGNAEMYGRFLKHFLDDVNYQAMCESIKVKDVGSAFSAAHALKGIAGNLSMNRLYKDLCPLVEQLRSGSLENVDILLLPVMQDYSEVASLLKTTACV